MKHNLLLLLTTLLCLYCFSSKATHIMGSDITYKCTSTQGFFEVTLVIYRKCDGGSLTLCSGACGSPCTQTMQIQGADPACASATYGSISLSLQSVRDVNFDLACPLAKNTCTNMGCVSAGTYTPAMERYEFKGIANIGTTSGIPSNCCNVRFVWSICCRSSDINTGAGNQNFYVDAIVNRCLSTSPCNSSPEFTNDPFAIICGGQNYVFNNGAVDPDLDSLSYAFTPALSGFGASVSYFAPYTFDKPMPWIGNANGVFPAGIHCDSINGDIMFTPPNTSGGLFTGVMAVVIKQWKKVNGVMTVMGVTRRDIQMTVRGDCLPNNPPHLITNPPKDNNSEIPKTNWSVCAGSQLCFTITAKDTDNNPPLISDSTNLTWNEALSSLGATFNKIQDSLGNYPWESSYRFCWTPSLSMASTRPYYFTVTAKDRRCPNPGRLTRAFAITVNGPSAITNNIIGNAQTICAGDTPLTLTGTLPSGGSAGSYNYNWINSTSGNGNWNTIATTQNYSPPAVSSTTWYRRCVSLNSCSVTLMDTSTSIKITAIPNIVFVQNPSPALLSYGENPNLPDSILVTFSDSTKSKLKVNWNTINYNGSVRTYNIIGTLSLTSGTCNTLNLKGNFSVTISKRPISIKAHAKTKVFGEVDPPLTFTIAAGNLIGSDTFSGALTRSIGNDIGKYVINQGTLTLGGNYDLIYTPDTLTIRMGLPIIGTQSICDGDSTKIEAAAGKNIPHQWFNNDIPIPGATSDIYWAQKSGTYKVAAHNNGVADTSIAIPITVFPKPHAAFTINNDTQCFIGNSFTFSDISTLTTGSFSRVWVHSDGTSDTSTILNKSYTNPGYHTETLTVTSDHGCKDSTMKYVFLHINNAIQPICLVTVDSTTQKNMILWERLNKRGNAQYIVYKETDISEMYSVVGIVPSDSIGLFIDTLSNPTVKADRYKIATIDTCGSESPKSLAHKTMHLTVNSGQNNTWNLIWESYSGLNVNSINIFRGNSPGTMSLLSTVQGSINSYTDLTAPSGPLYYMTAIDFGIICDPSFMKTTYSSSQSNIVSALSSGVGEPNILNEVTIYPNPVGNTLFIASTNNQTFTFKLYDEIGRLIITSELNGQLSTIDMGGLQSGIYLVEVRAADGFKYQKVVKQ